MPSTVLSIVGTAELTTRIVSGAALYVCPVAPQTTAAAAAEIPISYQLSPALHTRHAPAVRATGVHRYHALHFAMHRRAPRGPVDLETNVEGVDWKDYCTCRSGY